MWFQWCTANCLYAVKTTLECIAPWLPAHLQICHAVALLRVLRSSSKRPGCAVPPLPSSCVVTPGGITRSYSAAVVLSK